MKLDSVDLVEVCIVTVIWRCSTGIRFFRSVELVTCFLVLLLLDWFKRLSIIDQKFRLKIIVQCSIGKIRLYQPFHNAD